MRQSFRYCLALIAALALLSSQPAYAAERLCDVAFEDCRQPIIDMIKAETVGIDVSFWFMEDSRYATELIKRFQAGVPVRVLMDTEANASYPGNVPVLQMIKDAGIPMRNKSGGSGILHWKHFIFVGQQQVEFSGANFSSEAFVPAEPYVNYVDEVIYFSDRPSVVNSFMKEFDDAWTDTTMFSNYANISGPLTRKYPTYPLDPELQFSPYTSFASRSISRYKAEAQKIDVSMYRITDRRHTDQMIAAVQRGVQVRLITEQDQYRDPTRLWDAWNVDRMYMGGVQVRFRGHQGLSHEKLTLLYHPCLITQVCDGMAIFGSSNWTSASDQAQHENNIFTTQPWFFQWGVDHFERKWNNSGPAPETQAFAPLPPDAPTVKQPVNGAQDQPVNVTLKWWAGPWAHKYDVMFGTSPTTMTKVMSDVELGPSESASDYQSFSVSGLAEGTTYYWQVISRTMANLEKAGPVASFRTVGAPPASGSSDVVLWAMHAATHPGWVLTTDTSAAGGKRLANTNANAPKATSPSAAPSQFFDLGFVADAGVPYRLWLRGRATSNSYENDSTYVQFSDSVDASNQAQWRIGTASATTVTIEQSASAGLADWGWNDNGYGTGAAALGPLVYFSTSGTHTLRVQVREDGLSLDQIILSPATFLNTAPGAPKNDGTLYPEQNAAAAPPPTDPPPSTLPSGWLDTDIGGPLAAGSATYGSNTFSISGSGSDIWNSSDKFHFVYTQMTGDGSIVAKVVTLSNTNAWTKSGVMMRASLNANSPQASMFVSASKGLAFQRRISAGGASTSTAGSASKAPFWVKLVRLGDVISAYSSASGDSWTLVGTENIPMPETIYVGLPITSHADGSLASAALTSVSVSGAGGTAPPPTLPSPWVTADVGSVNPAGSASFNAGTGTWTVTGSGADIWGTADAFRYVSEPLSGDGEIVARVATVQSVDNWTKGGVMMRDTMAAGSAQASMFVSSAVKGTAFQRRVTAGGVSTSTAGPMQPAPYWVKMVRFGTSFSAYTSPDGVTWTLVANDIITMNATINVGLAVTSHKSGTAATVTFDNVTVTKY
jgi:regulation of enolase protein 1 (concanavalin A-like superfamily)/HKD family nuclease